MVELIGRSGLVAALRSASGVVVVWGPAGVGKSALVRVAVSEGLWCAVAGATDPEEVAVRVVQALGLPVQGVSGAALDARLGAAAAADGRTLVLDGLDLSALGPRLTAWRAEAPSLRVVVTARRPDLVEGDAVEVLPLSVEESVELLRALVEPELADDPALPGIAARVDGLPLVLHLAARAVSAIGPGGALALLSTTGLPPLDRLLDAAWARLTADQQQVLVRLGAANVPLDGPDAVALGGPGVLDALARLREDGLVRRLGDRVQVSHPVRHHLRRTFPGPVAEAARAWVAATVARVAEPLRRWDAWGDPDAWSVLAEREAALLDALRVATDPGERLVLLLALEPVVLRRGPYRPFARKLAEALDGANAGPLVASAARALAEVHAYLGETDEAVPRMRRAEALARACDAPDLLARTLIARAWVELHEQARPVATALLDEALALARSLPDRRASDRLKAHACVVLGAVHLQTGQLARAADANQRSARYARSAGDRALEAIALRNLGDSCAEAGDADRARALLRDALDLVRLDRDERSECRVSAALGATTLDSGDVRGALPILEDAVQRARRLGDRRFEGLVGAYVGLAHGLLGDAVAARQSLDSAVALAIRVDNRVGQAWALALRACVHAACDDPGRALADVEGAEAVVSGHEVLIASIAASRGAWSASAARQAERAGDAHTARLRWEEAAAVDPRWEVIARGSYDLRLTLRLRALAVERPGQAPAVTGPLPALQVAEDGGWFEVPVGRVDLQARGTLRRILAALTEARATRSVLSLDDLFARGWPGERAARTAARNRVYAAIHALRKLGLEDWIVRRDDGWCIDPSRPVRVIP